MSQDVVKAELTQKEKRAFGDRGMYRTQKSFLKQGKIVLLGQK